MPNYLLFLWITPYLCAIKPIIHRTSPGRERAAEAKDFSVGLEESNHQPKGDVNGDGVVDVADIASIISVMAKGGNDAAADVNNDGVVDVADIATVISIMVSSSRAE